MYLLRMHGGACAVLRLAVMEDGGLEDRWFDGWDHWDHGIDSVRSS